MGQTVQNFESGSVIGLSGDGGRRGGLALITLRGQRFDYTVFSPLQMRFNADTVSEGIDRMDAATYSGTSRGGRFVSGPWALTSTRFF